MTHFGTHLVQARATCLSQPMGTSMGVKASVWAMSRDGNYKKWRVAVGLGTFGITFGAMFPKIWPVLGLRLFVHVAAKLCRFWAFLGSFWEVSWTHHGVRRHHGVFDMRKLRWTWGILPCFPSFAVFNVLFGLLGQRKLFLAQNCADWGGHLPTWRLRPGAPSVPFGLKTWI